MIDYKLFKKIEKYAELHTLSSIEKYKQRNQNTSNIFENCLRGKLGEYACYFSMIKAGYILESEPDLDIYISDNKSYEADLKCIGKHGEMYEQPRYIHVKTMSATSFSKWGGSFLIESNDSLVFNPKENHYISVMLEIDLINYNFYKWLNAKEIEWDYPKLKHLTSKRAWYDR